MSIDLIQLWHEKARQFPTEHDRYVQTGVHFEEVAEMLEAMTSEDEYTIVLLERAYTAVAKLATHLKHGGTFYILNRKDFLDSLCDQIVTATGVGHTAGMNVTEGTRRVNQSNWTKMVDGMFVRDQNGKIKKPEGYQPPDLSGLY